MYILYIEKKNHIRHYNEFQATNTCIGFFRSPEFVWPWVSLTTCIKMQRDKQMVLTRTHQKSEKCFRAYCSPEKYFQDVTKF